MGADSFTPHAALPMYDWPETGWAWDALWEAIHTELSKSGIATQPKLRRDDDIQAGWHAPDLILGQTCGWPYVNGLRGKVTPMLRFAFDLPGRPDGDYHSVFIMHPDRAIAAQSPSDLAPVLANPDTVVAINETISQSGYRALGECLVEPVAAGKARVMATGSHRASIEAVATGKADIAAIDAVSWRLALLHEPNAGRVVEIARSKDAPGHPLIVAKGLEHHRDAVREAVEKAVGALAGDARAAIGLRGVVPARDGDYDVLTRPPYGHFSI